MEVSCYGRVVVAADSIHRRTRRIDRRQEQSVEARCWAVASEEERQVVVVVVAWNLRSDPRLHDDLEIAIGLVC